MHLLQQYIILKELSQRFVFCKSSTSGLLDLQFLKSLFTPIKREICCSITVFQENNLPFITPFNNRVLISNLCIYRLEWDYTVDSSNLSANFQWMSFEVEHSLWKILYLVCKIYSFSYNNPILFPVQYLANEATKTVFLVVVPLVF